MNSVINFTNISRLYVLGIRNTFCITFQPRLHLFLYHSLHIKNCTVVFLTTHSFISVFTRADRPVLQVAFAGWCLSFGILVSIKTPG